MKNYHKKFTAVSYVVLSLASILAILPFWLLLSASLTNETVAMREGFRFIPIQFSADAYRYMVGSWQIFGRAYLITVVVTLVGVLLCLALTLSLGYVLSREGLPGRRALTFMVLFTMLFNGGLVATYINYTQVFHIKDTLWALIIPNLATGAFYIVMVKNYFQSSIPGELFEAAKIDGATELLTFVRIALPLAKPITATLALLSGVSYWNDWQNGLYYLDNQKLYGIQNLLHGIQNSIAYLASGGGGGQIPAETVRMAAAVIAILPILLIYPFFQSYFVRGIAMGGVKE